LGVRGFPGNFISHRNSIFIPNHSIKTFVEGEVDMVSGMGYNNQHALASKPDIFSVVTNLGVFDFNGPDHQLQLLSMHPGVSIEDIIENTGFKIAIKSDKETILPSDEELILIREVLDPMGTRKIIFGE
jgi:glutaconate CoA-transferase subunit B